MGVVGAAIISGVVAAGSAAHSSREGRQGRRKGQEAQAQARAADAIEAKKNRPPPASADPIAAARERARRRAGLNQGLGSTNVTGGLGLTDRAATGGKQLLGQ